MLKNNNYNKSKLKEEFLFEKNFFLFILVLGEENALFSVVFQTQKATEK